RHFNCQGGVMLAGSHNPKEYNGYKADWDDGGQLVAPHDKNVIQEVNTIQSVTEIKFKRDNNHITLVGEEFGNLDIEANNKLRIHPEVVAAPKDLETLFSPIHRTGIIVPKMLAAWGFTNVQVVEAPMQSDGTSPTVVYPSPQEGAAMTTAKET